MLQSVLWTLTNLTFMWRNTRESMPPRKCVHHHKNAKVTGVLWTQQLNVSWGKMTPVCVVVFVWLWFTRRSFIRIGLFVLVVVPYFMCDKEKWNDVLSKMLWSTPVDGMHIDIVNTGWSISPRFGVAVERYVQVYYTPNNQKDSPPSKVRLCGWWFWEWCKWFQETKDQEEEEGKRWHFR